MDGITESRTLSGVVLATLGAAGYAVFRVGITTLWHLHIARGLAHTFAVGIAEMFTSFFFFCFYHSLYALLLGYVP